MLWEDKDCARRQTAAMLANMGRKDAAEQLLCKDMEVRHAMAEANHPCEIDKRRYRQEGLIELTDGTWVKPR